MPGDDEDICIVVLDIEDLSRIIPSTTESNSLRFSRLLILTLFLFTQTAAAGDGNRLTYLDEVNPWYPHKDFPKLTTPQWIGEKGVDAVVIFAIDDMRDTRKYETYLRPILNRLKKIDGRAPVSIMSCKVRPNDPQLQSWLDEGLSIECHTVDHPCPILQGGDFKKAASTYHRCVDLMNQIPRNKPVAFRTPCCDSLNTVSPRFYAEIFNRSSEKGHQLQLDSSVFNFFTSADKSIPRKLVLERGGRERFLKYLPKGLKRGGHTHDHFVNYIENYPYPYLIGNTCWQFPCVAPSDWSAQHLHGVNNPKTVDDWKAALDITVHKKGVFCLVFHPHGWIKAEQIVELIDHAQKTHGKKVKFLNFREAQQRLSQHLLAGNRKGIRLLDADSDGHLDVFIGNGRTKKTRIWNRATGTWKEAKLPFDHGRMAQSLIVGRGMTFYGRKVHYGVLHANGTPSVVVPSNRGARLRHFNGGQWHSDKSVEKFKRLNALDAAGDCNLRDLNNDGICELIAPDGLHARAIHTWDAKRKAWAKLPFALPLPGTELKAKESSIPVNWYSLADLGFRFVDLNGDGRDDIVFSNHKRYGAWLFKEMQTGWSIELLNVKRSRQAKNPEADASGSPVLPPIVRKDGTNNGFFVHKGHLCWQNEETDKLADLHVRIPFAAVLDPNNKSGTRKKANSKPKSADSPEDRRPKPMSPEMSLKAMQPRPGFRVELVAAEPLLRDPVAFEWGADGRMWVAEMGDYPVGPSRGRVRVLEDTDGDGTYDKSTLFLDGLNFPNGVLPWRKGVLITAAPDIIYAEDTNGDGKADVKKVLFTGFGQGNQQHRVNGLVRGLDNWVYCANGDSDGSIRQVGRGGDAKHKPIDIRGRDFRFNPDTGELQTVTGRTQFGRNRDDWGNWFGNNNSNPMYHFVLSDRYLSRNPHVRYPDPRVHISVKPGAAPCYPISREMARFNDYNKLNRFTSACSAIIYRDTLFGKEFAGNSFVSEPVHNLVHREVVKTKGVTFTSRRAEDEQTSEFLASRDNWFRPTMIKTGPDGALYVADMYRLVIEHPQYIPKELQKNWDFRAGEKLGRIYRVLPKSKPRRPFPRLDKLPMRELVASLGDSNGWVRDTAQRLLVERHAKTAAKLLESVVIRSVRGNALARLHALYTLDGIGKLKPAVVYMALRDEHPGVRRNAVRLSEQFLSTPSILNSAVAKRAGDSDPFVRLQLAYSLGEWKAAKSGEALAELLLKDASDRYITAAAISSIHSANLKPLLSAVLRARGQSKARQQILGRVLSVAAAMGGDDVLRESLANITSPTAAAKPDDPGSWKFETWQVAAIADLTEGLQRRKGSLKTLINKAPAEQRARLLAQVQRLTLFALKTMFERSRAATTADRIIATRILPIATQFEHTRSNLTLGCRALLVPQESAAIQSAVVQALGQLDDPKVPQVLLHGWASHSPSLRSEIVAVLLSRDQWAAELLNRIENRKLAATGLDATHRQSLLTHRRQSIRDRARRILGTQAADTNRKAVLQKYSSALTLAGNAARGKAIFKKTCSACHKLENLGRSVGPDLSALKNNSPEALLVAILDPSRNVESRYVGYLAATTSGRTYTGLLASEAGGSITLVSADGKRHELLRSELDILKSTGKSAMPDGLEKDLKPQDVAHVMAYVRSVQRQIAKVRPNGRFPRTIRPAKDGTFTLAADNCEIYGTTLKFEPKYKNLGWWGSADDRAVWPMAVPVETEYDVVLEFACDAATAGNTIVFECGAHRLSVKVPSTGSWDTYIRKTVGRLKLPSGQQRLTVRAGESLKGYLLDLKAVRLKPRK
eukprot:g8282.t1